MKKSDLYREWARVLDMCEGTGVNPNICWEIYGDREDDGEPSFTDNPNKYKFAVAILEGKPVFVGDKLYGKNSGVFRTIDRKEVDSVDWDYSDPQYWSWQPPTKRTFLLDGVELPCPDNNENECKNYVLHINAGSNYNRMQSFKFLKIEDRDKVADFLIAKLTEAMDKK